MIIAVTLLLSLAILLLWLLSKPFYWAGKGIKYLVPKPLVGNFGASSDGPVNQSQTLYNTFPEEKLYGFHVFMTPSLFIRDPEIMVDITIKKFQHFSSNGFGGSLDYDHSGGNLLFLHGEQWKEMRNKITPLFTPMRLRTMLLTVNDTLPITEKIMDENIKIGEPINQTDLFARTITDVLARSVFGIQSDAFEKDSKFQSIANILSSNQAIFMFMMKSLSPKLYRLLRFQSYDGNAPLFVKKILRDAIEYRQKQKVKGNDFIQGIMDVMSKYGKESRGPAQLFSDGTRIPKFDFDEMFLQAFIVYIGGVDSSAATLTWLFYELAKDQDLQQRCREEVMDVVNRTGNHVTMDNVNELPYTTAAVKETLRMYPPFPLMSRVCTKTCTLEEQNLTIYPGQHVIFAAEGVQRDPVYFPEPNKFNPERFLNGDPKTGYIGTFGLGPKMCLGKSFATYEILLITSRLLQKYAFKVNSKTKTPLVPSSRGTVNAPDTPLWLDFSHI